MNADERGSDGGVLAVVRFTVAASTRHGQDAHATGDGFEGRGGVLWGAWWCG
jgi:hypothetical protein